MLEIGPNLKDLVGGVLFGCAFIGLMAVILFYGRDKD